MEKLLIKILWVIIETLKGGLQYLSAGDGIYHSEHNLHESEDLRLYKFGLFLQK